MKKFFDYIQLPNFDVAADATATFKVVYFTTFCALSIYVYISFILWLYSV